MNCDWVNNDRTMIRVTAILDKCSQAFSIEIMSVVLYGSRARGDHNSQSEYELLILIKNEAKLDKYIQFCETVRMEVLKEKLLRVKISVYTPEIFEDTLYNDKLVGTFLYMICRDNIVLFDKFGTFMAIREKVVKNSAHEEKFLTQCIEFARMFGSEKWERKYEKTLMQFKYLKRRRELY